MKTLPLSAVFCLLLAGCASIENNTATGFTSAYIANPAVSPMTEYASHTGTQITHSPDLAQEEAYYTTHGYALLGVSSFVGSAHVDRFDLVHLAETLQADTVIWAVADADSPPPTFAPEKASATPANSPPATVKPGTDSTPAASKKETPYRYTALFFRRMR